MSNPKTILRYEVRIELGQQDRLEQVIAGGGFSAYTCFAEECATCHEIEDECVCDDEDSDD